MPATAQKKKKKGSKSASAGGPPQPKMNPQDQYVSDTFAAFRENPDTLSPTEMMLCTKIQNSEKNQGSAREQLAELQKKINELQQQFGQLQGYVAAEMAKAAAYQDTLRELHEMGDNVVPIDKNAVDDDEDEDEDED